MATRLWGLAFACLIPLWVIATLAMWIGRPHTPQPFRPFEVVLLLIEWSTWAILAPFIVALVWRVPLNSGRWLRGLGTHLIIGCLLALGEIATFVLITKALGGFTQLTFSGAYWRVMTLWYPYTLLVYWVIAVAAHAVIASRQAQDREVEAARLREQLTNAQLGALQMQLHPHFLCNTLNTVTVFLRDRRVEQAEEIVTGLGALLHTALDRMDAQEVTLRDELEFVGRYLTVERIRFSDRMHVTVEAGAEVLDSLVPCMILQPLVENAIRHGISRDPGAGEITIRASRTNGQLHLSVENDGPGLSAVASPEGHGVGLENTRLRLEGLYGDAGRLRLRSVDGHGAIVEISLPFHTRGSLSEGSPSGGTA